MDLENQESPPTQADALDEAAQGAEQRMADRPPAQEAPTTQEAAPEQETPPTEAPSKDEPWTYDLDYQGRKTTLSKDDIDYLVRFGLDAWTSAHQKISQEGGQDITTTPQQQAQPSEQEALPDDIRALIEKEVEQRTKAAVETVEGWRRDVEVRDMMAKADQAIGQFDVLKEVSADPQRGNLVQAFVMYAKGSNPDISWDSAAKQVASLFDTIAAKEKANYVKSKIQQAGRRVESAGGGTPAPGGHEFTPEDIHSGRIMESVINRLTQAAREP